MGGVGWAIWELRRVTKGAAGAIAPLRYNRPGKRTRAEITDPFPVEAEAAPPMPRGSSSPCRKSISVASRFGVPARRQ
jgi:hypothetical protein